MRFGVICLVLLIAGCASPREQCARDVTAELETLDRLIAQSQTALALGYREELVRPRLTIGVAVCGSPASNVGICADTTRPPQLARVAIDPAEEQRVLTGLQNRRIELLARRDRDIAQCAAAR